MPWSKEDRSFKFFIDKRNQNEAEAQVAKLIASYKEHVEFDEHDWVVSVAPAPSALGEAEVSRLIADYKEGVSFTPDGGVVFSPKGDVVTLAPSSTGFTITPDDQGTYSDNFGNLRVGYFTPPGYGYVPGQVTLPDAYDELSIRATWDLLVGKVKRALVCQFTRSKQSPV